MPYKILTISLPLKVDRRGHEASVEMFGSEKKFSTYIQVLINADCDKRKIK